MSKAKGEWLEKLLHNTKSEKTKEKKAQSLDPWEVEFMYRPNEVVVKENAEEDKEKERNDELPFCGAPLGLNPLKCFKCGQIGHVAADRSCPAYDTKANLKHEAFLRRIEDPMHEVSLKHEISKKEEEAKSQREKEKEEALARVEYYKKILGKENKKDKKSKKEKKKKHKQKHKKRKDSSSSDERTEKEKRKSNDLEPEYREKKRTKY